MATIFTSVGRRALARGLVGTAALVGAGGGPARAARAAGDPEAVVIGYYETIARRDYARAYDYLGASLRRQTLEQFAAGFADTAYVDALVLGVTPSGDGRAVSVRILAWHDDGSIHRFNGTYDVGLENGAEKLVAATIAEVATPSWVPPLCHADDLSAAATGDAGAGNRFATITLTNTSAAVCVLGGYPTVELRDGRGTALLEAMAEPEQPISTVTLEPGQAASFDLRWVNWCGDSAGSVTATVTLPGDDADPLTVVDAIAIPPCLGEGQRSSLTVRPFAAAE
jgi:hypothetical protein